jgi:hypothetical protein
MAERAWLKKVCVGFTTLIFVAVLGIGCAYNQEQMKEIKDNRAAAEAAMKAAQQAADRAESAAARAESEANRSQAAADASCACAEKAQRVLDTMMKK